MNRRGLKSVVRFADAMMNTLNKPQNSAKGPWDSMTLYQLREKLDEERREVNLELMANLYPGGIDWERLRDELVDEANVLMMLYDRCCVEIEKRR